MPDDPTEEWRPAPGFEDRYSVSSLGRVRRDLTGRILKPRPNRWGYHQVMMPALNKRKQTNARVHVLIALAFLGPRPPRLDVNHIDGDKANNRCDNLEWLSRSANHEHAYRLGLRQPAPSLGVKHGMAKLTEADVWEIRAADGSHREIARRYGIVHSTVGAIKRRRLWKHLT